MVIESIIEQLKYVRRCIRNTMLWLKFLCARKLSKVESVQFRCTVCGKAPISPVAVVHSRELPSCYYCGSNQRFRSIVAALSEGLFGEIIPVSDMNVSKQFVGIGLSDDNNYAKPLKNVFSYENTFYHKEPRLDITSVGKEMLNKADFVIASDVFEHVPPPIEAAFDNLFQIMKSGGVCIFSVPYKDDGVTEEHFPELFDYRIETKEGNKVLLNKTKGGQEQVFENLQFHGGHGETLELRLFSRPSLLKNLEDAGFINIKLHNKSIPEFGLLFEDDACSVVISMQKP